MECGRECVLALLVAHGRHGFCGWLLLLLWMFRCRTGAGAAGAAVGDGCRSTVAVGSFRAAPPLFPLIAQPAVPAGVALAGVVRLADAVLAGSLAGRPLAAPDLAVVPAQARLAPALVHPAALAVVQARYDTLGELTAQPVVALGALALILLDALAPVEALLGADSALAVAPLVAERAGAGAGGGAVAPVHALRVAEGRLAVLAHVPLRALADLVLVANPLVGALLVALRIRSLRRRC